MTMRFPTVRGSNLSRETLTLPADFHGQLNVVLIAFQQWHQSQVNTWLPLLSRLEEELPGLHYYELPTIQKLNRFNQWFINEGMRAGIRSDDTRSRTITLYLDKTSFRSALDLPHENEIYVLLLDRHGQVLWRSQGPYGEAKGQALRAAVEQQLVAVA